MKAFGASLRAHVGKAYGMRPLLCDGNPLTCTVAVVGANPGTSTRFWESWSDERGMDRKNWLEAYKAQHGGKFNRSRATVERFVPQVDARVIELNAFSAQSKRLAQLKSSHRTTDVLGSMLNAVRPKVIVCAGADALRAVRALGLPWKPSILEAKHFIYWGRESEAELAAHVNRLLQSLTH